MEIYTKYSSPYLRQKKKVRKLKMKRKQLEEKEEKNPHPTSGTSPHFQHFQVAETFPLNVIRDTTSEWHVTPAGWRKRSLN